MNAPRPRSESEPPSRSQDSGAGPGVLPDWWVYRGQKPRDTAADFPEPPPWRSFGLGELATPEEEAERGPGGLGVPVPPPGPDAYTDSWDEHIAVSYLGDSTTHDVVNAAIHLRRPLLVTGPPGTGKTTLAASVARELGLGPVLRWGITSRSTLKEGLYEYDVLGRLHDMNLQRRKPRSSQGAPEDIGRYIRLGPLGDALLPRRTPRVLLVDEIDKSDVDLPNDLLHVFETGGYEIPELRRIERSPIEVLSNDGKDRVHVHEGKVRCAQFPVVILTSNGEREFPPAFRRRCLFLKLEVPTGDRLRDIVKAHIGDLGEAAEPVIERYEQLRETGRLLSPDQLINAVRLRVVAQAGPEELALIERAVLHPLTGA